MSLKYQITLPEDLAAEMKAAAERLGIPLAQFIRETVQEKLAQVKSAKRKDPFAWMDGLADIDETDITSRVDEILYRDARVH
jgi:hypothetical protein